MSKILKQLEADLQKLADKKRARVLSGFFKTGKGEYAQGDIFLGIRVPDQRRIAKKYKDLKLSDAKKLLKSKVHEHRLTALLILVHKFQTGSKKERKEIVDFYLKNTKWVNNWDLVDLSADKILGVYLFDRDKSTLYKFAKSKNLWERRIAIIATFAFIKNDNFENTLKISELLLNDNHDLIHKAVGWMLREVGKKDRKLEEKFLNKYATQMPRTALRYAIEKFDEKKRKHYLTLQ